MLALLGVHLLAAVVAPLLVRLWGRKAFLLLAAPPAAAAAWALSQTGAVLGGHLPSTSVPWVPSIGMGLSFRLDTLAWLLTLVVGGVGALVLLYCADYFADDEPGLAQFASCLTGFAGAMLGLVTSDDLLVLYLFWELTTILSYLLIGHRPASRSSRSAATQALVVTTAGGLAMLTGIVLLGEETGTYRLSALLAHPPTGTLATTAVALLLVGAVSKSALVPFHFWLPGAMAAPTPVSAYLHAAAMVKAGIYLVARLAPAFADVPVWRPLLLVLGAGTMLLGGWRALRQHDLKLLLAYGTVSQLGYLTVLVGTGTRAAALAGVTVLVGHALFKSCLFLVVGAIDHRCGTRDLRELSGLRRRMPALAVTSLVAAASMAGIPPMLGFVGKEAAYTSLLPGAGGPAGWSGWTLAALVAGSVLTFAYAARFLWGAFGDRPAREPSRVEPTGPLLVGVPVLLSVLTVAGGPAAGRGEQFVRHYVQQWPAPEQSVHLGLWHGLTPALLLSALTVALGAGLFLLRSQVERGQALLPQRPSAEGGYRLLMRSLDRVSLEVTGALQRGSLPLSLGLVLVTTVAVPGVVLLRGVAWPSQVRWADNLTQPAVAVLIAAAAFFTTRARRRLRAVFLVGVTGYGTALLFLLHGAPDLALTQVLVETLSLVVFVLVVRRLSGKFNDNPSRMTRRARALLGIAVGAVVTALALTATSVRSAGPMTARFAEGAVEFGGGNNIVNVTLVDIRAWDTMGEISVVLVAATGVASLIFLREDNLTLSRRLLEKARSLRRTHASVGGNAGSPWLAEGSAMSPERRSVIFEVVTRLVFHTMVLWSLYLLFSGHNHPGGGFAAGLVVGLGLAVRYLAGERDELRAAAPVMPGLLLGAGLFLSAGVGLVSLAFGGDVLQSWIFDVHLPLIGSVHLVTSVFFDIGVYLVVIGLVLDILRSLGSGIDGLIEQEQDGPGPAGRAVRRPVHGRSRGAEGAP
ncbi:MAG TPA: Na+/H+ antiporter subunit A [Segeticoccus sp.]|uniref:Na+/H+ antiporter subunit A n=1 Tax=Segeticoccus sp. TaxID=2706531 RepID=UPI002D8064F9|nr:Na+/H+ antiporter subunit A [Segeticoccus sp.]HET8600209.1 Na+/H+ antiporter subunit A [Segeticoccus sp.]